MRVTKNRILSRRDLLELAAVGALAGCTRHRTRHGDCTPPEATPASARWASD